MSNDQVKFFPADFTLEFEGSAIPLRGLLSESGITRVVPVAGLPNNWKNAYGKPCKVSLDKLQVEGVLIQHFDSGGACSLIHFTNLDDSQRSWIQRLVVSGGVFPGWQRKLPRISVETKDSELPMPSLCTVRFAGSEIYVEVLNFTLTGLRIKAVGSQMAEARVGMRIQMDLITNRGGTITNFSVEIMNISVHDWVGGEQDSPLRYFGLKITDMSAEGKKTYKELIRDYCLAVKKTQP